MERRKLTQLREQYRNKTIPGLNKRGTTQHKSRHTLRSTHIHKRRTSHSSELNDKKSDIPL